MSAHRTVVAVDLAKTAFELAVSRNPGEVAFTRHLSRSRFPRFVAMEAWGSAAALANKLAASSGPWSRDDFYRSAPVAA
jgi:hypothetical protein